MHRAHYDTDGNIILESDAAPVTQRVPQTEPSRVLSETRTAAWSVVPETAITVPVKQQVIPEKKKAPNATLKKTSTLVRDSVAEGSRQLHATADSARREVLDATKKLESLPKRLRGSVRRFWDIARTPVKLRGSSKPKTKLSLFVTDTIRFGGTFALIFGVLFSAMNYQSFWQIARAQLAIGADIETEQALENISRGTSDIGASFGAIGKRSEANILKYLPPAGPYENRLIIPKLGKNVPIVYPGLAALMKEDWKQFENDIQTALHDGVVHYPGSARPGQPGNFFLTGHSSYYPWDDGRYKDIFARLPELDIGDTYSVYYGGDKHTYRIVKKFEVKPSDVTVLDQPTDKRISTLMTCTPIGTTLRRLIVQAEEIDALSGIALKVGQKSENRPSLNLNRLEALPI